jgi:peptidoglycan/LPS O-acetylase OafA/YrhL
MGVVAWSFNLHQIKLTSFPTNQLKSDLVDRFHNQWISNFTLGVDVFFALSGCLTAYTWFKRWTSEDELTLSQQKLNDAQDKIKVPGWSSFAYWLRFYRHRLVRLWPAYGYVLLSVTTRLSITHWHPVSFFLFEDSYPLS